MKFEQSVEIECSVVIKMTRGRGTRVGEELELSMKSNKARKSNLACFLTKMARGRGTRVGVGLELSMNLNKAWKSNSALFLKWQGGVEPELAWNSN